MEIFTDILKNAIEWVYGFSGDYGVAIVVITIAIRLALVPLNIKQRSQMKEQQEISLQAEVLKKKYRNNQKKLEAELQKLYQEKGTGMGGCLLSFLQVPIMLCLYHAIRLVAAAGAATVLLPWVSSLLARDSSLILPIATLLIQLLPQTYPYVRYFRTLNLQKPSWQTVFTMLLANGIFMFVIPSGVGLYYFVSGLFTAVEQWIVNVLAVRKMQAA